MGMLPSLVEQMKDTVQILDTASYLKGRTVAQSTQMKILRQMVQMSQVDQALRLELDRGKLTYFLSQAGNEAFHVGVAFGLKGGDWLFPMSTLPTRRGHNMTADMPGLNVVQASSPGASRLVHANGTAWAAKLAGEKAVSCVTFGESIANQDNFHVALNFAGVHQTPALFVCMTPGGYKDTAGEDIAGRAIAYGFSGMRVDGTDPLAVQKVIGEAARKARGGKGPTLIEAVWPEKSDESPIERFARNLKVSIEDVQMTEEEVEGQVKLALSRIGNADPKDCVFGEDDPRMSKGS